MEPSAKAPFAGATRQDKKSAGAAPTGAPGAPLDAKHVRAGLAARFSAFAHEATRSLRQRDARPVDSKAMKDTANGLSSAQREAFPKALAKVKDVIKSSGDVATAGLLFEGQLRGFAKLRDKPMAGAPGGPETDAQLGVGGLLQPNEVAAATQALREAMPELLKATPKALQGELETVLWSKLITQTHRSLLVLAKIGQEAEMDLGLMAPIFDAYYALPQAKGACALGKALLADFGSGTASGNPLVTEHRRAVASTEMARLATLHDDIGAAAYTARMAQLNKVCAGAFKFGMTEARAGQVTPADCAALSVLTMPADTPEAMLSVSQCLALVRFRIDGAESDHPSRLKVILLAAAELDRVLPVAPTEQRKYTNSWTVAQLETCESLLATSEDAMVDTLACIMSFRDKTLLPASLEALVAKGTGPILHAIATEGGTALAVPLRRALLAMPELITGDQPLQPLAQGLLAASFPASVAADATDTPS